MVGPVATGWLTRTSIPSRLSWKSSPSERGSNGVAGFSALPPTASSSIVKIGAKRPPRPITVGLTEPGAPSVQVAELISVIVRLLPVALPGRNSSTRPLTRADAPTGTFGLLPTPVKTNTPSEVFSSRSA